MITSQVVIPDTCLHLTSQNISQKGLFPSNFVTTDLDADARGERKRSVVFNEEVKLWFDCFLPDYNRLSSGLIFALDLLPTLMQIFGHSLR